MSGFVHLPTGALFAGDCRVDLLTEAQWEFAARGVARHRLANEGRLDLDQTNVFRGPGAKLVPVMSKSDDRTPGARDTAIFDVVGNALEWTRDLYLEDSSGRDDGWKQSNGISFRAVRGLPVYEPFDAARESTLSVAARQPICANGPCVPVANSPVVDDQRGPVLVRVAPAVIAADAGPPADPNARSFFKA